MIAESLKRLTMASLFVYLGGVLAHTATAVAFGNTGMAALAVGLKWPLFATLIVGVQTGLIST